MHSLHAAGTIVYAGTSNGVYATSNSGESWIPILTNTGTINSVTNNGPYIFAGTSNAGVYLTSNGGVNWISTLGNTIWSLDASSGFVYAAVGGDRVWRTSNNGALWEPVSPGGVVRSVAANGNLIFAGFQNFTIGGNGGVHVSTNGGVNWSITLPGKEVVVVEYVNSLLAAGCLDDTARSGGAYLSDNNGANWRRTSLDSVPVKALKIYGETVLAGVDNHFYPGFQGYAGFWTSGLAGSNWVQRNDGLEGLSNRSVSCIELRPPYAYLGISGGSVYRRSIDQVIDVRSAGEIVPESIMLFQNYPNPFNASTLIKFEIIRRTKVTMTLYDVNGKKCAVLLSKSLDPGTHETSFNGNDFGSGVYFCKLEAGSESRTLRMVLTK